MSNGFWFTVVVSSIGAGTARADVAAKVDTINPTNLPPLAMFQDGDACPEMIVMPPGAFMMGAIPGESRNRFDIYGENATRRIRGPDEVNIMPSEHPGHRVEMDIPYAIARNEITHAAWMACVDGGDAAMCPTTLS